jgi:predicted CXXCH cytochrome family protein
MASRRIDALIGLLAMTAVGAILLAAAARDGISAGAEPQGETAMNPHWSPEGCPRCHGPDASQRRIPDAAEADDLCLECHDGRRARREVHPTGRQFASEQIIKPEHWPAPDNTLGCLTCHDVRQACEANHHRPRHNPMFLRDYDPEAPLAFCAKCHVAAAETGTRGGYDPHVMLGEQGQRELQVCLFCHLESASGRGRRSRTGSPGLRADELTICASCHHRHVDYFEPGHIGHPVSQAMRETMLAAERTWAPERGDLATSGPAEHAAASRLPLTRDHRITCSTCHNPHQEGVFAPDSLLACGAMRPETEDRKPRLRGLGKELCRACHPL